MKTLGLLLLGLALMASVASAASTNLLMVVQRYADSMIEHGRDAYGPQKSGLLLSALDRTTLDDAPHPRIIVRRHGYACIRLGHARRNRVDPDF